MSSGLLIEDHVADLYRRISESNDPEEIILLTEAIKRERAISSPVAAAVYCTQDTPTPYLPFAWATLLNQKLLQVTNREIKFLIVEAPVRHGKSLLGSIWFPFWYLGTHPNDSVIVTSYNSDLAIKFGRQVRDLFQLYGESLFGIKLNKNNWAARDWTLSQPYRGGLVSVGVGSPPTGRGGNLIVIDDPIKSSEEAYSEAYRSSLWDWWQFNIRNRLEPGGVVVIIMSRWHHDDLVGRLRKRQMDATMMAEKLESMSLTTVDGPVDRWEVLRLPAIAEEGDIMGRAAGAALCPERYDERALASLKFDMGDIAFEALLQNNPQPLEGGMFKSYNWRYTAELPPNLKWYRVWDMASTEKKLVSSDPDWTVGALMARRNDGYTYVADIRRLRADPADIEALIKGTAIEDAQLYDCHIQCLPIDPGSAGVSLVSSYARHVLSDVDCAVYGYPVTGDKTSKAIPLAGQQGMNRIVLYSPHGGRDSDGESSDLGRRWYAMIEEAKVFPKGQHDDMVDAMAAGYRICIGALELKSPGGAPTAKFLF